MVEEPFGSLEEVVTDPRFPAVDHTMRTGGHVDVDDIAAYELLQQGHALLGRFYEGYRCRLRHAPEGYFHLVSEGDLLGHAHLTRAEMLVGQMLALVMMEPAHLAVGGIDLDRLLVRLGMLVGEDRLLARLSNRKLGEDRATDAKKARIAVRKALNRLEKLGFLRFERASGHIRPRKPVLRFADPVREATDLEAALEALVARGEVTLLAPRENA